MELSFLFLKHLIIIGGRSQLLCRVQLQHVFSFIGGFTIFLPHFYFLL